VGQVATVTGLSLVAAGAAGAYGLKKTVDAAVEWDRQVRLTFTQVDKRFKPSLEELGDIGLRVARDVAVPFDQIQGALFDVFSSTEANMPQAEMLLRQFSKAAVAGQTDIQTASRATIGLMNSFKVPFKDVNKLLDIQFQLVQEGVGSYEEWAEKIGLVSPSAVRAGQSIEGMAAALATATRQGMSTSRAATSVARAFDAMSNPKTEKALAKIGVKTRDAKGNFRPLVEVLADWRKELEKMPKEDRIKNILDTLKGAGGTIEARRFLQNILLTKGGLELFQGQMKEFATDKGAFQKAYNEMAGSVAAKSQLLKNSWETLKVTIGKSLMPIFSKLIDIVKKAVDWFNKLPKPVQNTIAQFLFWASVLTIVFGAALVLVGILITFAAVVAAAGTALIPVVAVMAAVAAVTALVAAGIAGLVALFVLLYNKSKPFRDMINSIGSVFVAVGSRIKKFAQDVWKDFETYLLPSLKKLWAVIEKEILPEITKFVNWFKSELEPRLAMAAALIRAQVVPAFQQLAAYIESDVIPALRELKTWWQQNQYWIKPLVSQIFGLILVLGLLTGFAIASTLTSLRLLSSATINAGRVFMFLSTIAGKSLVTDFNLLRAAIQRVIDWFRNLGDGAGGGMRKARNAVTTGINSIKSFFGNAGSWLRTAGGDLVRGLINGIDSMLGQARAKAQELAATVKGAVTAFLGIRSPSKVFKDIGMDVVRGLTQGISANATRKQLQTALYRLSRDITRSINAADISKSAKRAMLTKWNARLANTTKILTNLESKRAGLQTKLAAAQKSVNDQIKERNELAGKISEAVTKSSDLTSLSDTEKRTTGRMVDSLKKRLADVKTFQANLRNLASRGFDKETIAQLAQQGVEGAGQLVATLVKGSNSDLAQISKIQAEIRKIGGDTGSKVAGDLYNAGIKAGQGLIKGLQSQIASITKMMAQIATALVKQIKKELGIKSPSKVFEAIGMNTARGYINGYVQQMNRNMNTLTGASLFTPDQSRVGFGGGNGQPFAGTSVYKTYDIKQTIHTQEIDPRKTAADLGWELQGRLP